MAGVARHGGGLIAFNVFVDSVFHCSPYVTVSKRGA